jgi:hypothetical protein
MAYVRLWTRSPLFFTGIAHLLTCLTLSFRLDFKKNLNLTVYEIEQKFRCVFIVECTKYLFIIFNSYFLFVFGTLFLLFVVDHRLVYIFSQAIPFSHVRFDRSSDWIPAMEEVESIVEDINFRYTIDERHSISGIG